MAKDVTASGIILCSNPYNIQIRFEVTVPAQNGTGINLWITSGATYSIDTLTIRYNGVSKTISSEGDEAILSAQIYGANGFFYQRGVDSMTITGRTKSGDPVTFEGGSSEYRLIWDTPNTVPTAEITSEEPYAGRTCLVSWAYRDADNDDVSLVSLIRYYRAAGASSFTATTLLTSGNALSYTDTIPAGYGGGELYYAITYSDTYGGTGTSETAAVTVIANTPPSVPGIPVLPGRLDGGATVSVTWQESADTDGNLEGYRLERAVDGNGQWEILYQGKNPGTETTIPEGISSAAFRVCAYDTYGAQSAWAQTENLTVYNNQAPPVPASITVPGEISTGSNPIISWPAVTDPDGDTVTYHLERAVKSGSFTEIYSGSGTSYTDTVEGDWETVAYRVCAQDERGARSAYRTSGTKPVILNFAPVITLTNGPDGDDYGVISEPFTLTVKVTDKDNDKLSLEFSLDGEQGIGYDSSEKGEMTQSFKYSASQWQKIPNGEHILTIKASDGTAETTKQVRFTKEVRDAVITLDEPYTVSEQIEVCVISVDGVIPDDAELTVEVTNNGNDTSPVWEDATEAAISGGNHAFSNTTQKNGWAFNFRVTVHGGDTRGYITSVQGGFQ